MDIEVEFPLYVVRTELSETNNVNIVNIWDNVAERYSGLLGFVPGDDIRQTYLVHSCEERQEGEY